eukprot:TRINITY_DN106280_c0_g1_i1.p1 TRINITY_DN106280_c0_g1~~TRINITY_DN106280_c0_g1_i1.p1  ORF type:complete len:434 (-),score=90.09 TRINITY_DN106280_c0_g1_i1:201-1502(-)
MEELRQELLKATCRWLEAETQWDEMGEETHLAYNQQCGILQNNLMHNRYLELLRQLREQTPGAAEEGFTQEQHAKLRRQARQSENMLRETDFPQNLQAVHRSHKARAAAREERKRLFKNCQKAESAQAGYSSVVGLQLQRQALHQVQKVSKDCPGDVDAMWAALSKARSAGVAVRDLSKYENVFVEAQAKQSFQAQVFAFRNMCSFEVSGMLPVGEMRQRVADKLGWRSQRTRLLFNGKCLMIDSQTLHQCGVTQESCDFIVVQIQDEVEDSLESFQNQTEASEESMLKKLRTVGMQVPQALHQPDTESTVGKPIQRWTFEFIKVACAKRVMDFPAAASLYRQVEDGLLGEDQARMTIRNAAKGMEGIERRFESLDKKYIAEAKQAADKANSHLSFVAQNLVPAMQKEQAYSKMLAQEMRSWASPPPPSTQKR